MHIFLRFIFKIQIFLVDLESPFCSRFAFVVTAVELYSFEEFLLKPIQGHFYCNLVSSVIVLMIANMKTICCHKQ